MWYGLVSRSMLLVLALLSLRPALCRAEKEPAWSKSAIVSAWEQREQMLDMIAVEWTADLTMTSADRLQESRMRTRELPDVPSRLLIKGNMYRYEHTSLTNPGSGAWMEQEQVIAFNGKSNQFYMPKQSHDHNWGMVQQGKSFDFIDNIHIQPFVMAFRPRSSRILDANREDIRIGEELVRVRGRDCVEIKKVVTLGSPPRLFTMCFYCPPEMKFLPIRYASYRGSELSGETNVEYAEHPAAGWVPVKWGTYMYSGSRGILEGGSGVLVDITVNEDISEEQFTLAFPVGTRVQKDGEIYSVAEDGSFQLLHSDPMPTPPQASNVTLIWICAAIIILLLFLLLHRRTVKA